MPICPRQLRTVVAAASRTSTLRVPLRVKASNARLKIGPLAAAKSHGAKGDSINPQIIAAVDIQSANQPEDSGSGDGAACRRSECDASRLVSVRSRMAMASLVLRLRSWHSTILRELGFARTSHMPGWSRKKAINDSRRRSKKRGCSTRTRMRPGIAC